MSEFPWENRLRVLGFVCLGVLLVLAGRLWILQLTRWTHYASLAAGNRTSVSYFPAPRGLIFDRTGQIVLAENRPVWSVGIVLAKFPDWRQEAAQAEKIVGRLASILRVPTAELRPRIQAALKHKGREIVPLDERIGVDIPFSAVAQIEEQALPGIVVLQMPVRMYPQGKLAAHVLGYARAISEAQYVGEEKNPGVKGLEYPNFSPKSSSSVLWELPQDPIYGPDSVFGQAGVERQYEIWLDWAPPLPILTGRRGRTVYEVDATGRPVRLIEHRLPAAGANIYLNLHIPVQRAAEQALYEYTAQKKNRSGAAVVMDVEDGGIVAMASTPAFNPNDWVGRLPASLWRQLTADPRRPLLNKATSGGYPPGSTFKVISMTAALELGKITSRTRFYCTGYIREGTRMYKCWKRGGHGSLDLRQALAHSCDVYFYELVRKAGLKGEELHQYAAQFFGLGEKTGIDLPEEIAGFIPSPEWKQRLHNERWWTGDSLNMVIGQGWITVTPLQMARVCAAIANGGYLLRPHIVRRIEWPAHFPFAGPTEWGREVQRTLPVRPETLQIVRESMRLAVTEGTAQALKDLPVAVAGKTGSAEHLPDRPPHSWFICFAPYEKPKYAIAVCVAEGGHGVDAAVPITRQILIALFGLKGIGAAPAQAAGD